MRGKIFKNKSNCSVRLRLSSIYYYYLNVCRYLFQLSREVQTLTTVLRNHEHYGETKIKELEVSRRRTTVRSIKINSNNNLFVK